MWRKMALPALLRESELSAAAAGAGCAFATLKAQCDSKARIYLVWHGLARTASSMHLSAV